MAAAACHFRTGRLFGHCSLLPVRNQTKGARQSMVERMNVNSRRAGQWIMILMCATTSCSAIIVGSLPRSRPLSAVFSSDSPHQSTSTDFPDDDVIGSVNDTVARTGSPRVHSRIPRSAYYLSKDEDRINHNFISFIDHTFSSYDQVVRLVEPRYYARPNQFEQGAMQTPPTVDDIAPPPSNYGPVAYFLAWNRLPARMVVGGLAYVLFCPLIDFLRTAISQQNIGTDSIETLVNTFLPGVAIVLGTYFSLTLSILYDRFSRMQATISLEGCLLALVYGDLVEMFQNDSGAMVGSVQCVADQIGTLVRESRGRETMRLIYSDPYARILRLVTERSRRGDLDPQLVGEVRSTVGELFRVRSKRLSDEALALAPTHFDVLTFLSGLLLVGFALGTAATVETDGDPSAISRVLFAALVVCYVILYEMGYDLNRPFDGIYQIRRSGAAMHFLQVKHLISQHPLLCDVIDFELDALVEDGAEVGSKLNSEADSERHKSKIWYN